MLPASHHWILVKRIPKCTQSNILSKEPEKRPHMLRGPKIGVDWSGLDADGKNISPLLLNQLSLQFLGEQDVGQFGVAIFPSGQKIRFKLGLKAKGFGGDQAQIMPTRADSNNAKFVE